MAKRDDRPKQKTKPAKGKAAEIPVPTRRQVMRDLQKAVAPVKRPK